MRQSNLTPGMISKNSEFTFELKVEIFEVEISRDRGELREDRGEEERDVNRDRVSTLSNLEWPIALCFEMKRSKVAFRFRSSSITLGLALDSPLINPLSKLRL